MQIFLNILFLLIGLLLLIKGADFFVEGASGIARKMKVSSFIIGVTVVAIGTSLPELSVSIMSSIKDNSGIVLGNVIGSNMFNMLFALGLISLIAPMVIKDNVKKIDMPILLIITTTLLFCACNRFITNTETNVLSRLEGVVLLSIIVLYMCITISKGKDTSNYEEKIIEETNENQLQIVPIENQNFFHKTRRKIKAFKEKHSSSLWYLILSAVIGLGGVILGGECVSSTAEFLALKMGMSEMLVGITIVAISTSLPELVVSIMAVRKNDADMALGNLIGSSILNIGLVLSLALIINEVVISSSILISLFIMAVSMLVVSIFVFSGNKINKYGGILLMLVYISYIVYSCIAI